jgi:phosphoglycolate phosphatase
LRVLVSCRDAPHLSAPHRVRRFTRPRFGYIGPVPATVFLWDVDGTLISTAGAGRRAIELTFERRYGRADVVNFPLDGMTDPTIIGQGLAELGLTGEAAAREMPGFLGEYLGILAEVCAAATNFRVHAGIEAALALCQDRPEFAVGLGTGNIEQGARLKLARVDLNRHFAFGGYGSDHADRAEMLAIGARRGRDRLGLGNGSCRVVVIGDTPKDIAAARAIGAESIAVATGSYSAADLRSFGATHAVANLADPAATLALLGISRSP